ncbi:MAG TPA: CoA pyrophosphatase [Rhodospirillaceae bacterium]|nr:CoA pyrophosphatase [Rhodospirillaceae bacterium]
MEQRHLLSPGSVGQPDLTTDAVIRALSAGRRRTDRSDVNTSWRLAGNENRPPSPSDQPLTPAAVLVPMVWHADGITILLTQRTSHLAHHAGQVSFPGGRVESNDADAVAAALREAQEEIGLDRQTVRILGRLDDYVTVTGFCVTPVVAAVTPPLHLEADPFEVAEIFEVPLAFILDPANHQRHSRVTPDGIPRHFFAMPFGAHYIWGATAGMLINLFEMLTGQCAS